MFRRPAEDLYERMTYNREAGIKLWAASVEPKGPARK